MNRGELRQLAETRLAEAQILLRAGMWSGAYYLVGYAVECGLKACIAKGTKQDDFP
jgi:HEPN domain-containing protein